ncbi:hypothetical protein D3C72_1242120 [compost metagenome]
MFDLEAREERHVVPVLLHAVHVVRHHHAHEGAGLFVDLVGIDQDLADIRLEVIADGADHQARFQVDQQRGLVVAGGAVDGLPQLQQVVQVPLQFLGRAADASGAGDDAHAVRHGQLAHRLAQFLAVLALDAARYATATRVVRHQHQVAAGQRDKGGQGGALVAALFLLDLDDQFLAFVQGVLDARVAHVHAVLEERTGHFLERQEAVALFAVVDEAGFQRGLDAGDDALVDVALALLAPGGFDVDIDQFLTIDDRDAQFFLLRRVEQHAFHRNTSLQCRGSHTKGVRDDPWSTRGNRVGAGELPESPARNTTRPGGARVKERGCRRLGRRPLGRRERHGTAPDTATCGGCPEWPGAMRQRTMQTALASRHRGRPGMAKTRQRASFPDAASGAECQPDLSPGGRAAASWSSATGRR